jgi:hypothetical protein
LTILLGAEEEVEDDVEPWVERASSPFTGLGHALPSVAPAIELRDSPRESRKSPTSRGLELSRAVCC